MELGEVKGSSNLRALEKQVQLIERHNAALKAGTELKNTMLSNSFFSLVQGAVGQTSLNSFANLAYFNSYAPLTINWTLLTYMYKTHGILQTAIDMPVLDALRGGIDIHSDELDSDDIGDLQDLLEQGGILATIGEAMTWTRLYGGGGIIVNTDNQDSKQPLDLSKLREVEFYAANRWELVSPRRYSKSYDFYGEVMDSSRVLTMGGKAAPYLVRWTLQGWGMSEMERMLEDFNMYLRTKDLVYELLKEAKLDVYQFEGLTSQLASAAGTQLTQQRVQLMNQMKSYQSAVVMDVKDKFEQKQLTFSGLADIQKQNMVYIASALRMPLTKIFGLSASGFNSGEDDIENYNAMVESEVRAPLRLIIRKVLNILIWQKWGREYDFNFEFKPLRMLGAVDEETVRTSKHNRYLSLYSQGLLTAQEIMGLEQSEKMIPIESEVAGGADPEERQMPGIQEGDGSKEQPDDNGIAKTDD